jgi:hypothetical protein
MKLMKTGILEYIVVFVGIVALLAYIRFSAEANQPAGAAQASSIVIDTAWTSRAGAAHPAARLREVVLADDARI